MEGTSSFGILVVDGGEFTLFSWYCIRFFFAILPIMEMKSEHPANSDFELFTPFRRSYRNKSQHLRFSFRIHFFQSSPCLSILSRNTSIRFANSISVVRPRKWWWLS